MPNPKLELSCGADQDIWPKISRPNLNHSSRIAQTALLNRDYPCNHAEKHPTERTAHLEVGADEGHGRSSSKGAPDGSG